MAENQLYWDGNTWNHLTVGKEMRSGLFKNDITNKLFGYNIWLR